MRNLPCCRPFELASDRCLHSGSEAGQLHSTTLAVRLALTALFLPYTAVAQIYDQTIDIDQSSTVNLTKPGSTVLVGTGVTIAPGSGSGIVGRPGDTWEITNRGTIQSSGDPAIRLNGPGSVLNEHVISGGSQGIYGAAGLRVTNAAGALIQGYSGVAASGQILMNNAGTISGTYYGLSASLPNGGTGADVVNRGEVLGGYAGIYLSSGSTSSVSNTVHNLAGGQIRASFPAGDGVTVLHGTSVITNDADGTIAGGRSGISGTDLLTDLHVVNAGTVTGELGSGIWSYGGGPVSNLAGGSISGAGGVAYVRSRYNSANVLVNAGTINGNAASFVGGSGKDAGSGAGVYFGAVNASYGGFVNNEAGGSIKGTVYGIYSGAASTASDAGPISVTNAGSIVGQTGIALNGADGMVINKGVITGSGGNAIVFEQSGSFANMLTLDTGSVLNGNVLGGRGSNELILLGANVGDTSKFRNFQTLSMQGNDWTLTGTGGFATSATVASGTLRVDGTLTTPVIHVQSDATLGGSGTLVGNVVNDGTLAPGGAGNPVGTLTINGNLTLTSSSVLNYQLGQAGTAGGALNDLTVVSGDLSLAGTLNVSTSPGGTYGPGLYRLFNYGGTLIDNGLALGSMPAGSDNTLLTSIPGQVNLVNRAGLHLTFWDGDNGPKHNNLVDGGNGIWQSAGGNDNWTIASGAINDSYANGSFATFAGAPGTVTVDNSRGDVTSSGMQFAIDGYRVQGDPITLSTSSNIIRVGDGTAAGAGFSASIASVLRGAGGIEKTDLGTLVLAGANSYTGSTTISGGVLQAGAANVFAQSSNVIVNRAGSLNLNGHDQIANQLSGDGSVLLGSATLTANNASGTESSAFNGVFSGTGGLAKTGNGTLVLAGAGSQVGSVDVRQGTLRFEHGGAFTTTGDFTTQSGASTDIGEQATTLVVGGSFTQTSGANLAVTLGASPDITAQTANLDGTLTVKGFDAGTQPVRASAIQGQTYTVLHTTGGITGNFNNNPLTNIGPDYLPATGAISADGKDYNLGFRLAWTQGGQTLGTGTFSMAQNTAFDVDLALTNQTGPFNSGWDGKSLTKSGEGLLVLSNAGNTYSGGTTVNGGVLRAGAANVFAQSSDVVINSGATLDLNGYQQVASRLTGAGAITLGSAVLTANNATEADSTTFSGNIAGTGGLTKIGAGTLTLSGETLYRGDTRVQGGQLVLDGRWGGARLQSNIIGQPGSALLLRDGAMLTGSIDPLDLSVDAASTWNITANSVVNQLSNAGTIGFTAPPLPMTQGRTLTVNNLNGLGGRIGLYTVLGNSGSLTDRLVIDGGKATGLSVLQIHNAGGLGDQTTGNGIPVVVTTNGGATEATAFDLGNPVLAGAYRYSLQRGGSGAPEDWFLVSNKSNGQPDYRAETSLYSALQTQAVRYGDAVLGAFHERRGANADLELGHDQRVWTRVIGQNDRSSGAGSGLQGHNVRSEANIAALQIGGDLYGAQRGEASTRAGLYGAIGQSNGWTDHVDAAGSRSRAGDSDFTGYSLGLYGTWLDGHGSYLDAVLQGTYYDTKSHSNEGMKLSTGGYGVAASLEAGRRYELAPGLHLQPQAQMVYQHLNLRDASDAASRVLFPSTDTALLRLGARLSKDLQLSGQAPGTTWASADLLQRVGDRTRTRFSTPTQGDVGFSNDLPGTALRLQTGVEGQVRKNVTVNARIGVEHSIDGSGFTSLNGQVGLKIAF
ncbi:autotransporter outer membrane beta-barrel domain-containing protein [Cupriavidus basilensis]|uniref:Autotransporter outer membrane beta-barrel domain-containing protein n=1 Tax=Cupriavidus basilensis TaxID=68895 RepID=A0ABT6ATC7_9BURK|nr:autotransporter outer membrane beta-barrel domain-containing protein [Cupriavidus basilensis]MDF3835879.1 autotransporter outer membrane beta-barrel domain-containing protein [Cupriavidus basilensis]